MVNFAIWADNRVNIKENEKRDKYLDFAWELKKNMWNMRARVIPIVISALRTIPKRLAMESKYLKIIRAVTI